MDSGIRSAGIAFTSLLGGEAQAGGAAWADWDLSAIVPAGTKYALVGVHNVSINTLIEPGVKAKGSGLFRRMNVELGPDLASLPQATITVEVDANRLIEIYGLNARFGILGYWR